MNKTRLKFIGSLALVLTTAGVLLAVGGQLNFLGNQRPQAVAVAKTTKTGDNQQPKYSFYDELRRRKIEIENGKNLAVSQQQKQADKPVGNYRYVVQVGAFVKEKDANKIKKKVEGLGYPARVVRGGTKYLAQAGPFVGKDKANSIEKRLKGQKLPTLIKRLK